MKLWGRVGLLVLGSLLATAARADDRVQWFRNIVVEQGETFEDVVCLGCSILVKGTTSDVTALWGSVDVEGQPSGDVVAVGGGVRVHSGAKVDGDIVAIGGPAVIEPGGSTTGETEAFPFYHFPGQREVFWQNAAAQFGFSLILAMLAYVLVRRRRVENMVITLSARPWMSLFIGVIFLAICFGIYRVTWFFPRLTSIWGEIYAVTTILLAIPYATGFIGVCSLLGGKFRWQGKAATAGSFTAAIWGAILVALFLLIPLLGLVAWLLLMIWTTGVALLSRFGGRPPLATSSAGS